MVSEKRRYGGLRLHLAWVLGAGVVLAYFLRFTIPALGAGFAVDDAMNLHGYWSRGIGQWLLHLILFPSNYGRPMGGLYYLPLYYLFGLNPLAYHVVTAGLLLANTCLAYRFGVLLSGSRWTGFACAFPVAFHPRLAGLAYEPSFIYDVLCFTFYLLAFNFYVSARTRGLPVAGRRLAWFLLLYIGALESKEMAVTLPVMILLYEAIWHAPERWSWKELAKWITSSGRPGLAAGLVTLAFVLGKIFAPDSPIVNPVYAPTFTLARYFETTTQFLNEIFDQPWEHEFFNPARVIAVLAFLFLVARGSRRRHMLLMWFFILIAPLPVTFVPGRGGGCLYLPVAAWSLFVATLAVMFAEAVAALKPLRRAPAAFTIGALLAVPIGALWAHSAGQAARMHPLRVNLGRSTWFVLDEIRAVQPSVRSGARIYVLNDTQPGYDTMFVMRLAWGDRSVQVFLDQHDHLPAENIRAMDYVFRFEKGKLLPVDPRL
jgi:hypothetical protein